MAKQEKSRPMRMVCTACGGWRETTVGSFMLMTIDGNEPGSEDERETLESRREHEPFIDRHFAHFKKPGDQIAIIYEDEDKDRWNQLDPRKKES